MSSVYFSLFRMESKIKRILGIGCRCLTGPGFGGFCSETARKQQENSITLMEYPLPMIVENPAFQSHGV